MAEENIQVPTHLSSGLPVAAAANGHPAALPEPAPATVPNSPPRERQAPPEPKDNFREVVETVVFVVVLVLLLKSFVAEAFVIPTGSMAETLWGYQKVVDCPECGHEFPVNCKNEIEGPEGDIRPVEKPSVVSCTCPNCRLHIEFEMAR